MLEITQLHCHAGLITKLQAVAFLMKPLNDIILGLTTSLKGRVGGAHLKFNGRWNILCRLALAFGVAVFSASPGFARTNDFYVNTFGTIAGSPTNTGSADGPAPMALFNGPQGTAVDTNYNVFVSDTGNNTIRKLVFTPTNWVVSTIAGLAGTNGSADGTNSFARFKSPEGITVDSGGNVYVADTGNDTIRKLVSIGTNWVVSTIAGSAGTSGSANGTNSNARFKNPQGIAADANGNLYVADTLNHTIRMMTLAGSNWVVSTIAGLAGTSGSADGTNSNARFNSPEGITVDSQGNVYVADTTNDTIRELTLVGTNWLVTTIAGLAGITGSTDGTNGNALFDDPGGIAVSGAGTLYVADSGNETIRTIIPVGTNWVVSTSGGSPGVAGYADGTGTNALFTFPKGIAVDLSGDLYVDGNTVSEGISVSGGVALLGENFASGNQYWINVQLGPPAAVTAGAAWGLAGDPPSSLSAAAAYTRYFTTSTQALQFAVISGWEVPANPTINIPPHSMTYFYLQTNLYYTVVPPVLTASRALGLQITGTANTTYYIQSSASLLGFWTTFETTPELATAPYQIESPPAWPPVNVSSMFYRAIWTGN